MSHAEGMITPGGCSSVHCNYDLVRRRGFIWCSPITGRNSPVIVSSCFGTRVAVALKELFLQASFASTLEYARSARLEISRKSP